MRTAQEVFDAVINGGFYRAESRALMYSFHMCFSLEDAKLQGVISQEEMKATQDAITHYVMGELNVRCVEGLESILLQNNLPCDFPARLSIYQDWENRPNLAVRY